MELIEWSDASGTRYPPQIVRVDQNLSPQEEDQIRLDPRKVWGLYDFVPFAEGVLFFGDVFAPSPTSGLVYADASGELTVIYDLAEPFTNPAFYNYATDDAMRFLARTSDSDTAYMLFLDEQPAIGRIRSRTLQVEILPEFPADFRHFPSVAETNEWAEAGFGLAHTRAFLEVVEKTPRVALGIYMDQASDKLYLLARSNSFSPGVGRFVQWWLIQINGETGAEVKRTPIPSSSAHLTVVPGRELWTLVEKDPVERIFVNRKVSGPFIKTSKRTLLPSSWLRETKTGQMHSKALRLGREICTSRP